MTVILWVIVVGSAMIVVMVVPRALRRLFGEREARMYEVIFNLALALMAVYSIVANPGAWKFYAVFIGLSLILDIVLVGAGRLVEWHVNRTVDHVVASRYDEHEAFNEMRMNVYHGKGSIKRKLRMIRFLNDLEAQRQRRRAA